jgi:hypothetical protein
MPYVAPSGGWIGYVNCTLEEAGLLADEDLSMTITVRRKPAGPGPVPPKQ